MDALHALAAHAGVDVSYTGWKGEPVPASTEALIAVLAALGHDVRAPRDAAAALALAEEAWWSAVAPPVVVGWDGGDAELPLRVRADVDAAWEVEVVYEDGETMRRAGRLFESPPSGHVERGGQPWCLRTVLLDGRTLGYHRVRWQVGGRRGETLFIAAPRQAQPIGAKTWGAFAPLHALRSLRSGAAGDLGELARLARQVAGRGGRYVATLPLLAAFLDEPCEPSPYAPASRMFWNELYLELAGAPGFDATLHERKRLLAESLVDYRAQYAWRREILDRLAAAAWAGSEAEALERFAGEGDVADYAAFRAIGETHRAGWARWPEPLRDAPPRFAAADVLAGRTPVDPARWRTHVYAQRAMDHQLSALDDTGAALYLDLPVGVNRDAYDVWRHRDVFVLGASTGAPPDALFLGGQDWGLPPLHPQRIRDAHWAYVIACVRHHVRHAGMLRIDHVMGVHRLYWVPNGLRATDGVYVHYAAGELYAILCLESFRHGCALVGEDLGTVPEYVPPAMRRHGMSGLYVGQFAFPGRPGERLAPPSAAQVASLNTHDTPTFGGWWRAADVDDKLALGLIDELGAAKELEERAAQRRAVIDASGGDLEGPPPDGDEACANALLAVTRALAATDTPVLLVSLEDAWLETRPQNVPGTAFERPNWRRPFALDTDAALADLRVDALLDAARRD
jgi:4-alpha-glucanotransferase